MKVDAPFGSPDWVEKVFAAPPVDLMKGRTRYTQAHVPWDDVSSSEVQLQGRNEYIPFLVLCYLRTIGLITRFKAHPFFTTCDDLGWEIRPDLLAEGVDGTRYVIEAKTARFVTREVELLLEKNRSGLEPFGLKYLYWSDWSPMTRPVRHNLINMRRCAKEEISSGEFQLLVDLLKRNHRITVEEAIQNSVDLTTVFAAWWRGKIFLALTEDLTLTSKISLKPMEDYGQLFLQTTPIRDSWWSTLPQAA